jgi:ABC-type transport system involved in Fe-S cluster assembly fused permease/ATPase subunit
MVVMRGGRVAETGRHAALVRAGGYHADLVRHHSRGLPRDK